jgi:hypothetical protein
VIESCYAGNFNTPGVTGQGRTVMGSCDDEPADATGGGTFTNGFVDASNSEDADANDDDTVDPGEAFDEAADGVDDNNAATGRSQEPWIDSQECECKCPCHPSIDVDKWVWDDDDWVDEMDAYLGAEIFFLIDIENDGECRNVTELEMVDTLPSCLSYGDDASVLYTDSEGEESELSITPSMADTPDGGMTLTFDIGSEIGLFAPDETIAIEYSATSIELGENINYADGSARCTYDDSIVVTDNSSATVNVIEEPEDYIPPPEDVMEVLLTGHGESYIHEEECYSDIVVTSFGASALNDSYPITNVVLKIDGVEVANSGTINTTSYDSSKTERYYECGESYNVSVTATNSLGLDLTRYAIVTPELILEVLISGYANLSDEEPCTVNEGHVTFEAFDLTEGESNITEVSITINGLEQEFDQTLPVTHFIQSYEITECGTYELSITVTNSNDKLLTGEETFIVQLPES